MMALFMTCLTPEASSKLKYVGKNDLYVVIKDMKVLYYIQWPLQIDSVFDHSWKASGSAKLTQLPHYLTELAAFMQSANIF